MQHPRASVPTHSDSLRPPGPHRHGDRRIGQPSGPSVGGTFDLAARRWCAHHRGMTDIRIAAYDEQPTAGRRETVPFAELTDFFGRAFAETMAVLQSQGVDPTGPPFGKYYGTPTAVVDVEAGFPVAQTIAASGGVVPGTLPGGKVVEAVHVGPYDTMEKTYAEIQRYVADAGLTPDAVNANFGITWTY